MDDATIGDETRSVHSTGFFVLLNADHYQVSSCCEVIAEFDPAEYARRLSLHRLGAQDGIPGFADFKAGLGGSIHIWYPQWESQLPKKPGERTKGWVYPVHSVWFIRNTLEIETSLFLECVSYLVTVCKISQQWPVVSYKVFLINHTASMWRVVKKLWMLCVYGPLYDLKSR